MVRLLLFAACALLILLSHVEGFVRVGGAPSTSSMAQLRVMVHLHAAKGFGSSAPRPAKAPPSKGFGAPSAAGGGAAKVPPPMSPQQQLERTIQQGIDGVAGLREAMNLKMELDEWAITLSTMSSVEKARLATHVLEGMEAKRVRLLALAAQGWDERSVSRKLQEITWDASAHFREERHQTVDISATMDLHMCKVADWALRAAPGDDGQAAVLDVGTGTGILFKFLQQQHGGAYQTDRAVGIDLSAEMVGVARTNYPKATFVVGDFLEYQPEPTRGPFDAVVFNECLHNFLAPDAALTHALALIRPGGHVVVSHPRGFDNVFLQHRRNKWLSPSLLPTADELGFLADAHGADMAAPPNVRSAHYLAVLKKRTDGGGHAP
jgi:SAM-dependent methyltransferase